MANQLERRIRQLEQAARGRQAEPPNPHGKAKMTMDEIMEMYGEAFSNAARRDAEMAQLQREKEDDTI